MNPAVEAWNRFWFDFAVPASKLNLVRVMFFGVLAVDAFLQLSHAPRYGAGGFNVSHVPALDGVLGVPSRAAVAVSYLLQSYLAARIVFGVSIAWSVRMLAVLFGLTYFVSQLNAYQHHYLVFLLLVIACFVPWDRARREVAGAGPDRAEHDPAIATWALRLLIVQLALLYAWAAVAKLAPAWLDGTTLDRQMTVPWVRDFLDATVGYAGMAWLVMLGEAALVVGVLWRRAWPVAWVVGVSFHVGVELAGFEIGLFSYFMLGLYALFIPDRWVAAAAVAWRRVSAPLARGERRGDRALGANPALRASLVVIAAVGGALLVTATPFESVVAAAVAIAALGVIAMTAGGVRALAGHVLACAVVLTLHVSTDQAFDYYRYLGGTSRRLGDTETMRMAYRELTRVRPDYGPAYYHLGNLARGDGDLDAAAELYRSAQLREPKDARPFAAAAEVFRQQGDDRGARDILEVCVREVDKSAPCQRALNALDPT